MVKNVAVEHSLESIQNPASHSTLLLGVRGVLGVVNSVLYLTMQEVVKMMYVLVETEDTSGISLPLKTTNRIKFLCFAASENFLVFGASSGGLYVFIRKSYILKALVPGKEGPVTCVNISPDEKWFGFSTARGISCVLEQNGTSMNRRILSHVHEGRLVTALQWNNSSSQLYVGDNTGQISVISVASYLTPAVALMQLDSAVVQLDTCSYMLVASTTTRSYLCDTFREQYRQIGTRLRDGEYGACFFHVDPFEPQSEPCKDSNTDERNSHGPFSSLNDGEWLLTDKNLQNVKLFCARPGFRLWEVRIDGAVMSTHQFKQLRSTAPSSIIQPPAVSASGGTSDVPQEKQLLQFTKLSKLCHKYLITYDPNGLCVLNPMTSEVILWTDQFKNIIDAHVVDDTMYVWMGDSKLRAVSFTPIDKFLVRMYLEKKYAYCAHMCAAHVDSLKKLAPVSLKMHVLTDLLQKIKEEEGNLLDESILSKLKDLLDEVSKNARNQGHAQMLNSGIFIVGNAHLLSQRDEYERRNHLHQDTKKIKVNESAIDIFPNLVKKQDFQPQDDGQSERDSMNRVFMKSILPTISSLSLGSEQTGIDDEDYDPFPDLPLSSLTSAETFMALKNLKTTVSGTISNSTKTLREKWQNLEEKFRGQEESGLGIEKSVNRHDAELTDLPINNGDDDEDNIVTGSQKKNSGLPVSSFMEKCYQVTCCETDGEKDIEELEFQMLDSFAVLYEKFRESIRRKSERHVIDPPDVLPKSNHFQKWLNSHINTPFPFIEHFDQEFFTSLRHHFQRCLTSGSLVKWLVQFLPFMELDYRLFPSHIGRIYNKESLLLDQALGRSLEICSGLLDPHTAFQNLEKSCSPCQYFSWNVIMDHFHKNPNTAPASSHAMESSPSWPLPRVLNAVLVMLQLGQVDSCRSIAGKLSTKHVLRTVLKLKEDLSKTLNLYLSYLEKVPMDELLDELKDPEVYYFSRYAFESLHQTDPQNMCACGYPVSELKFSKMFRRVGQTLLSHVYHRDGLSEALLLCQRTYGLWYYLLLLRRDVSIEEVLPLILQTGCEDELRCRSNELSASSWDLVLQLRCTLEQGHCLQCNIKLKGGCPKSALSWTSVASILVQGSSVDFALSLLSKYSHALPAGSLNLHFYQRCLLASLAENLNIDTKKNLMEMVTDNPTIPVMTPEVAEKLGLPHSQDRHHWGLHLQLSQSDCFCCLLPLASSSSTSVVSFQCHHSFHSICLPQRPVKQCPICIKV